MGYKLVMFDFDGTLADTFPWALSLYAELTERFDLPLVDPSEYEQWRGRSVREMMHTYGISPRRLPRIGAYMKKRMAENLETLTLFPGVAEMLGALSQHGLRLAVVSSNDKDNIRAVLGAKTDAHFEHYECGVALFGKAGKLRHTLRVTGVARQDALYIGDEIHDLEAAREAEIDFGAVAWGYNTRASLAEHHPAFLFGAVSDITAALTDHRQPRQSA